MAYLSVKLDHVAVLRQTRKGRNPDPSQAAALAELAGCDGITIHLRRDRRHIREKDLFILKEIVATRLTVEIAPTEDNVARVIEVKPYMVTFVPEVDREITTQCGWTLHDEECETIGEMAWRLQEAGIKTALHIEPSTEMIKWASKIKVDAVKLHTGVYASARTEAEGLAELGRIERTSQAAGKANLLTLAGQGIDYTNLAPLVRLGVIDEFVIGQAIIARAILTGMDRAVRDALAIIHGGGGRAEG